jgi:hypothetical protein
MVVTIHNGPPPQVLLTAADVERWKQELVSAEAIVADLKRKLDAAAVFFPASAAIAQPEDAEATVGDWVLKVMRESKRTMTPREIRAAIARSGGPLGSENYLYTAIKRETDKDRIVKFGDGYRLNQSRSPQGEAGDPKAPGPDGGLTLSGGAVDAVPEVGGT